MRAAGEQDQAARDQPRDNDAGDRQHRDASPVPRLRGDRRLRGLRQLALAPLKGRRRVGLTLWRLQRREGIRQTLEHQLVDALRPVHVLQLVRTEISQLDSGPLFVLEQRDRCL